MTILNGVQTTPEALLQRIDAIMRELQEMRRLLMSQSRQIDEDLVEQLWGSLGQGTWDEYHDDLDREYFG
ncbi:MAG: hypothetical protein JXA21_00635 [Anaerolineae bacterium]|nr:hypothetical protein [Anaerolineae bacterium]